MKLAIIFSSILATSSALVAPSVKNQALFALHSSSAFENELGAVAPTGFFDPLGISSSWDAKTFACYQNGEIKNGHAAMLGVLGYIVPEVFCIPGKIYPGLSFADIPNSVAALKVLPGSFWVTLLFCIGMVFNEYQQDLNMDKETFATHKQSKISNGHLAMLAFCGQTQDYGSPFPLQLEKRARLMELKS
jgi:hypothetical protein